jgi:hypothetical protein
VYEAAEPSHWNALRYIGNSGGWGLAFHDADYLRDRWGEVFPSIELVRGPGSQDMVLLAP